uniref:Uncharacterized protein n=1 Tax=Syphacia muris TaxID=451379 RepID=A0A0N5AZU1_9BILA
MACPGCGWHNGGHHYGYGLHHWYSRPTRQRSAMNLVNAALLALIIVLNTVKGYPLYSSNEFRIRMKRYFHPGNVYFNGHHGRNYNNFGGNYGISSFSDGPDDITEVRTYEVPPPKPRPALYSYGRPMNNFQRVPQAYPSQYSDSNTSPYNAQGYDSKENSFGRDYRDDFGENRIPGFAGDFRQAESNDPFINDQPDDIQGADSDANSESKLPPALPLANMQNTFTPWGQGLGEYISEMKL